MQRSSGVLCHISSLPSPYGVGTLGKAACDFADFLAQAGQRYWQVLPLGPISYGDSPYQCASAFAGNPYFIDLDLLVEDGLLTQAEIDACDFSDDPARVDYAKLFLHRETLLRKAFARGWARDGEPVAAFLSENADWLPDYAAFCSIKAHFSMRPWNEWDEDIRLRAPEAVARYAALLFQDIAYHTYVQYLFFKQWRALREGLTARNIRVIGDLPIYVPYDSADVWVHPELFLLDEARRPLSVAGVPPDYFSSTGQLWGNPLYDYARMAEDGFSWWQRRIRAAAGLYDVVRIDHFRGFDSYWAVPFGAETAAEGAWREGPGMALVSAIKAACPALSIIAEDLGMLTPSVRDLLAKSGFPGMRVLEFGFSPHDDSLHLPHNHIRHCVAYTGTHDNPPVLEWLATAPAAEVEKAVDYLNLSEAEGLAFGLIRGVLGSTADLAVAQIQDYLALSDGSRMNTPGTLGGNWRFRILPGQLTDGLARRMAHYARLYGRAR